MKRFLVLAFVLGLCVMGVYPVVTQAQQDILTEDVGVVITPRNPAPMDDVEIRLKSFATNIDTAYVSWFVNGRSVQTGIGMTSYSFTMGPAGTVYDIEIRIRTSLLNEIIKKVRLSPLSIDLLWEAVESYTPPFYRGKALPASESNIRVVAVPQSMNSQNPQRFVYAWKNNGETDQKASGFNKRDFLVTNDFFSNRFVVDADIVSQGGDYTNSVSLLVPRVEPKILFELRQPGQRGRFLEKNLPISIANDLNTLIAHPFFFSSYNGEEGLDYRWSIAGQSYADSNALPANYLPLVPRTGQSGSISISVGARHDVRGLQNAEVTNTVFFTN